MRTIHSGSVNRKEKFNVKWKFFKLFDSVHTRNQLVEKAFTTFKTSWVHLTFMKPCMEIGFCDAAKIMCKILWISCGNSYHEHAHSVVLMAVSQTSHKSTMYTASQSTYNIKPTTQIHCLPVFAIGPWVWRATRIWTPRIFYKCPKMPKLCAEHNSRTADNPISLCCDCTHISFRGSPIECKSVSLRICEIAIDLHHGKDWFKTTWLAKPAWKKQRQHVLGSTIDTIPKAL